MVGILLSYWGGLFSGAMLVSGRVKLQNVPCPYVCLTEWRCKKKHQMSFYGESHRWHTAHVCPVLYVVNSFPKIESTYQMDPYQS